MDTKEGDFKMFATYFIDTLKPYFSMDEIQRMFKYRDKVNMALHPEGLPTSLDDETKQFIKETANTINKRGWPVYDKIGVIKACREKYGWGLVEAKKFIEEVMGC